jgi:hypothetical protein
MKATIDREAGYCVDADTKNKQTSLATQFHFDTVDPASTKKNYLMTNGRVHVKIYLLSVSFCSLVVLSFAFACSRGQHPPASRKLKLSTVDHRNPSAFFKISSPRNLQPFKMCSKDQQSFLRDPLSLMTGIVSIRSHLIDDCFDS